MCIKETCFNANLFPVKNYKNRVITIFNIKVCSPLDPANPLCCILIWYIDTTYVSGEAGSRGGGHTSKLKMVMTLFFKYLTGNKFAFIDICMIRMCNKIKIKAS